MFSLRNLIRESKTRYYQLFESKRVPITMARPIISITFDDVPRSVVKNGIPILDQYNIKATFYVAAGLSESRTNGTSSKSPEHEAYLSSHDIRELHKNGHNIACHTYSHYMLDSGSAEELERDACKNVQVLQKLLGPATIEHFSYPFGQVNFKTKKLLSKHYKSMRSSRPGINLSSTDMHLLRATSIYSPTFKKSDIKQLIEKTEHYGGWLILYTHGVEDFPDNYSCTPKQFEWTVKQCSKSTALLLPISDAYKVIESYCPAARNT